MADKQNGGTYLACRSAVSAPFHVGLVPANWALSGSTGVLLRAANMRCEAGFVELLAPGGLRHKAWIVILTSMCEHKTNSVTMPLKKRPLFVQERLCTFKEKYLRDLLQKTLLWNG